MQPLAYLILPAAIAVVQLALSFFKDYRFAPMEWLAPSAISGAAIAMAIRYISPTSLSTSWTAAIVIGLAFFLLRARRVEAEWTEGLFAGSVAGATAASILSMWAPRLSTAQLLIHCIVAGGAAFAVPLRLRRARFAVGAGIVLLLWILTSLTEQIPSNLRSLEILVSIVVLLELIGIISRAPVIRRELEEEAAHGFVEPADVLALAHPLKRFRRANWVDRSARREYVRLATELSLRKARQRRMPVEQARLHQLEVLRVRKLLQGVADVERAMRAAVGDTSGAAADASAKLDAKG